MTAKHTHRSDPDPDPDSGSVIAFERVCFAYPHDAGPVLNHVSFTITRGERVGIVGDNGCGKSTLLHMIVGLLRPTSGRIEVLGKHCRHERDFVHVRHHVGLVFQNSDDQLFCPTVAEDVAFGPLNQGRSASEVRDIVARTLEQVGLPGFEDRITYRLSGGEKKLIALATVLAMEPEVLLLDEPTAGLAPAAAQRVIDLLARLDITLLLTEHNRHTLDALTDRRLTLDAGRIT